MKFVGIIPARYASTRFPAKVLAMLLVATGVVGMWMAVFADSGVAMLCVLNSIRLLYRKK